MDTLTTPWSSVNKWLKGAVIAIAVSWMALYPIYTNYYRGYAIEQYNRLLDFKSGKSMFFNPWQYRVLCPWLLEAAYQVADATIFRLVDFSNAGLRPPDNSGDKNELTKRMMELTQNPEFIKYNIIFVGFRFLEHLLIFGLAWIYFSHFTANRLMRWLGLMLIAMMMGNAVIDSDLSFNTYMDVILYLLAGLVIMRNLSPWWIVAITTLGAFNRETSLLIPVIYFFGQANYAAAPHWINVFLNDWKKIVAVSLSVLFFLVVFVSIRWHYGYVPATRWRVPAGLPMLKLNLFSLVSVKSYMEMFGVFGILPLLCLLGFRQLDKRLRILFIVLVPAWFAIHFWSVVCYQTRLFLVPSIIIFLPAVLNLIERNYLPEKAD